MITRKDYMENSTELHDAYYRQFVTPYVKQMVLSRFGLERLKVHCSKKLGEKGYISLGHWDALAGGYDCQLEKALMKELGDSPSLAGGVCILKQAARVIVEENQPIELQVGPL